MDVIALNGLISTLLADGETFDGSDADRLIAALPINSKSRGWSLRAVGRRAGRSGQRPLVMAGGPAHQSGEGKPGWRQLDTSGDWMHVGMYRVQHEPGLIHFRAATPGDHMDRGGEALLHYDRSGRATGMDGSYERYITLWRVRLAVVTYRPWKRRA